MHSWPHAWGGVHNSPFGARGLSIAHGVLSHTSQDTAPLPACDRRFSRRPRSLDTRTHTLLSGPNILVACDPLSLHSVATARLGREGQSGAHFPVPTHTRVTSWGACDALFFTPVWPWALPKKRACKWRGAEGLVPEGWSLSSPARPCASVQVHFATFNCSLHCHVRIGGVIILPVRHRQ
jgi:hypothetical protein